MYKLTYVITRTGQPALIPVPVKGYKTGKTYGHAHYQPGVGHVFRIPGEEWERIAGEDILQFRPGLPSWKVRCEVEFDEQSQLGEAVNQLDALKADNASLAGLLEEERAVSTALRVDLETLAGQQAPPAQEPAPVEEAHAETLEERLAGMKFPDLLKEAEDQNGHGAKIDVPSLKTKLAAREALASWYNQKAA